MVRIGLLGGTFDPVHSGHLQLAHAARKEMCLDKVLLIPAATPPHKAAEKITDFAHRRAMLQLAVKDEEDLEISLIENDLPQPSYTISTIRHLTGVSGNRSLYYFIIGIDAFADLLSWKAYRELLSKVSLIVAWRKGFDGGHKLDQIAKYLGYRRDEKRWRSSSELQDIFFLSSVPEGVSSSVLRKLLVEGDVDIPGIDHRVQAYIKEHHLYQK